MTSVSPTTPTLNLDNIDLRSLAARSKYEHLALVLSEQREHYKTLIHQALLDQTKERKQLASSTGIEQEYPMEDSEMLIFSLLSQYVEYVPDINESNIGMEITPAGTIGNDSAIRKRERKKQKKQLKLRQKEDDKLEDLGQDVSPHLDEHVNLGVGMTCLLLSTISEHIDSFYCMKVLLENGANPTARQPLTLATPLHLACLQSVRGAQAANANSTSISNDILSSNLLLINKIKLLLHYGCDDTNPNDFTFINLKDQADMTPLHAACLSGQDVSIVELLLINGADPNAQDQAVCVDAGWTPMHHLAAGIMYDQIDTVNVAKMLLKYKADPSIRGRWIDKKDMNTMGGGGGADPSINMPTFRKNELPSMYVTPDEIASKLNKTSLIALLLNPRKTIDINDILLKNEFMQTNINQEGLKICACNISKIYHQLTPLAKRIVGVFVFLLLTFLLLMYNDYAMSAGATGASCLLSLLCFIVLKRDDKWDNGQRKGKYVMIQRYQDKLKLRNRKELEKKSKQEEEKKKTK